MRSTVARVYLEPPDEADRFLPEGPRFAPLAEHGEEQLAWAFGVLGTTEQARYLASLYVDDLADVPDAGGDRVELEELRLHRARQEPGERRLAAARGAPEDEQTKRAGTNETRQRAVFAEQMILSGNLVQYARTQAIRERPRRFLFESCRGEKIGHSNNVGLRLLRVQRQGCVAKFV